MCYTVNVSSATGKSLLKCNMKIECKRGEKYFEHWYRYKNFLSYPRQLINRSGALPLFKMAYYVQYKTKNILVLVYGVKMDGLS